MSSIRHANSCGPLSISSLPTLPSKHVMLPTLNSVCMSPQICPLAFWMEWPKVMEPGPCSSHHPYKPRCSACGTNGQGETDIRHRGQNEHMEGDDFPVAVKGGWVTQWPRQGAYCPIEWIGQPTRERGRLWIDSFLVVPSALTWGLLWDMENHPAPQLAAPSCACLTAVAAWEMLPSSGSASISASIPASCFPENAH